MMHASMKKLKQGFRKNSSKNIDHSKIPPSPPSPVAQQPAPAKQQPPPLQPQPQQPQQPQQYHHIRIGHGGIISCKPYIRGNPTPSITYLGTTDTLDTVGVFFEISDTECFMAHIEAFTLQDLASGEPCYSVNFRSAIELRSQIIDYLGKVVPGPPTQRMRDTLLMTCARLSGWEARGSEVAAKAVREWLGAGLSNGGRVAIAGTGFVVGWPAAGHVVFEQAPGDEWSAVENSFVDEEWCFLVVEEEVYPSDEAW
jgi:hypothetical protein